MGINKDEVSILIVEDDEITSEIIKRILLKRYKSVYYAENGKMALNTLWNNEIDLIITDLKMPEMDGIELIKNVRSYNKKIPIIVMSAYSDANEIINCIELGITKYLLKPFTQDKLLSIVDNTIIELINEKELIEYRNKIIDIMDSIETVIYSFNPITFQLNYINSYCQKLFNRSPKDFFENPMLIFQLADSGDLEKISNWKEELFKNKNINLKYRINLDNGIFKWINNYLKVITDENEKLIRIDGYIHDITKMVEEQESLEWLNWELKENNKLLKNKLLEQEANSKFVFLKNVIYENILRIAKFPIYSKDSQGTIIFCNHAFCEFLQKKSDEIIGKTFYELFDKNIANAFAEIESYILYKNDIKNKDYIIEFRVNDLNVYDLEFSLISYINSDTGEAAITGIFYIRYGHIFKDITNIKITEKDNNSSKG